MKKRNQLILGLILFALIMSFFLDNMLMSLVAPLNLSSYFDLPFGKIATFILLAGISFYFYKKEDKKLIIPLWVCAAGSYIISTILKLIIERPRLLVEKFLIAGIPNYSFPSSHATVAFAVLAVVIKHKDKKLIWFWSIYTGLTILNRILMKYHYLSDIAGGALLGYGVSILFLHLMKEYKIIK